MRSDLEERDEKRLKSALRCIGWRPLGKTPSDQQAARSTMLVPGGLVGEALALARQLDVMTLFRSRQDTMKANINKIGEKLKAKHAAANSLDLVIVMDCTGSMSLWITEAKRSVLSIIENVKSENRTKRVRVGFVAYRDFCDYKGRIVCCELTENIFAVKSFISALRATGGGDGPEDVAGALDAALKMPFDAGAMRVILVADYPGHGSEYHNMNDDATYAAQIAASPCLRQVMRSMAHRGIDFTFVEIVPENTAKMAAILRMEHQSVVAKDGTAREYSSVSLADSGRFAEVVESASSSSLSASKARSVFNTESKEAMGFSSLHYYGPSGDHSSSRSVSYELVGGGVSDRTASGPTSPRFPLPTVKPLSWEELDASSEIEAIRHSYHFRQGAAIDWSHIDLKHTTQVTKIKLLPSCFARGDMRSAHAMHDLKMGKRFVAKMYYGRAAIVPSRSPLMFLENDVKTQVVAKKLATEFSLLPQVEDGVDFIFTSLYEIKNPEAVGLTDAMALFTAEPYIDGEYKKYNNNNGWINERGVVELRETAQAFSHFTWQHTFGQLMVVDLQGVGCIFTDPQIHSIDRHTFGRGNLSEEGMAAFFLTHKCNRLCAALGLTSFEEQDGEDACPGAAVESDLKSEPKADCDLETVEDKSMTCSCPLCGTITQVKRSAFVKASSKGREVYCGDCDEKVKVRETRTCSLCSETTRVAPYWYEMKGIAQPTTCKKCKGVAAEMLSPASTRSSNSCR